MVVGSRSSTTTRQRRLPSPRTSSPRSSQCRCQGRSRWPNSSAVEEGSVLAHIDDVLYKAKVAQSKAQLQSAEAAEAMTAFFEKRPPNFAQFS